MSDSRPRHDAEAADWFARLGARSVSADALEAFERWRRQPENARAYARVEATWQTAGTLSEDPDIRAATARAAARPLPRRWRMAPMSRGAILGGGALAALAVAALVGLRSGDSYATRVGEQRLVVLSDGSRVRLNTDSQLSVRYTPGERRLSLGRGEAFFEAAHDPARPFIVDAGLAKVRAVGTRFDVRRLDGAVGVTLLQGQVRVRRDGDGLWTLVPNQRLVVPAAGPATPAPADPDQAAAWTSGRIAFHATPLRDAVAEVNRYSRRKLTLSAEVPGQTPVSGVFNVGDTEGFVSALSGLFGLRPDRTDDGIVLRAGAAPRA